MLLLDSQELEYLLEHLGHPETLKEKKFQEWLLDNDHRLLFERVRDYREAYLRVDKGEMIDLAKEWEQFEVNVQKKSRWGMRRICVVAASVLIFLLIGTLWQPTEIETVKVVREAELIGKKSAELILANGQHIDLEKQIVELREENGIHISNSTQSYLAYRQDTLTYTVDSYEELVYNTVKIPAGADYKIYLADGSEVWLNCGSELRYPVKFVGNERRVYLRGEAFFEVTKDPKKKFIVNTEYINIEVLGTMFNVYAYEKENTVEMVLLTGQVKINTNKAPYQSYYVKPNEKISLDKQSGTLKIKKTDARFETAWLRDEMVFRSERLETVFDILERKYGVTIQYENFKQENDRFTGSFNNEELTGILDILKIHYHFTYKVLGNRIIIYGEK